MIVGIGVDVVEVERLARALERTPSLMDRVFTPQEQEVERLESLAARFAAKEAVYKALRGRPHTALGWPQIEIVADEAGAPRVRLSGAAAELSAAAGIGEIAVSISHAGAFAFAVASAAAAAAARE